MDVKHITKACNAQYESKNVKNLIVSARLNTRILTWKNIVIILQSLEFF